MTVLVADGFELERTDTAFLRRYPASTNIPVAFPVAAGRLGGSAYEAGDPQVIHVDLPDTVSGRLIVGLGIKIPTLDDPSDYPFLILYGAADILVAQLSLVRFSGEAGFRIKVERNSSGGLVEELVLTHILAWDFWYYLEVDFRPIIESGGTWVKINHDTEIVTTTLDDTTLIAGYTRLEIDLQPSLARDITIDDLYVADDFLDPDYWIQGLSPIADIATYTDWTPIGEATHFETVDDAADTGSVDDDTTYVQAGASVREDRFLFAPIINASSQPPAVRIAVDAKSTGGAVPFTPVFDGVARTQLTLGASYAQQGEVLDDANIGTIIDIQDMETGFIAQ